MCTGPVGPQHACHVIHGYITNRRRITRTTTVDKFACDRFTFASVYNTQTIIYRQPLRQRQAIDVIEDIGRRISMATQEPPETTYLFQHISAAIQRGNFCGLLRDQFLQRVEAIPIIKLLAVS